MDLSVIFTTAFIVGFSGAMMPGPLLAVTVSETARRGFRAGPLIVLGHALLELALVAALVLGLASVLGKDAVKMVIGVVGGLFLLYFGLSMSGEAVSGKVSLEIGEGSPAGGAAGGGMHPVAAGILVSLSNPYWSMWWATVGLLYISQAFSLGTGGIVLFFSGHILSDLAWYSLIAALVAGGRRFISQGLYSGVMVVCGLFVAGLGDYFVWVALMGP